MKSRSKLSFLAIVSILLFLSLACRLTPETVREGHVAFTYLGYYLDGRNPSTTEGDQSAAGHIFIHKYPIKKDGWVTGLIYLNDLEPDMVEKSEVITLLILRPEPNGWRIISSMDLEPDDNPIRIGGITTTLFDPIQVMAGDVFGHFQGEDNQTGPIPLNLDDASQDGLSVGKAGFSTIDILPGSFVVDSGFSGARDYYLNLIYQK